MANYVLEILDGDRAGEVTPVGDALLRIGRKAGNDLVLADEKTSGVHCEIAPDGERLVLKDLGSTNGTFLDGKRVTEVVLTPGDVVTVGRLRVRFQDAGADGAGAGDDEFSLRTLDAARLQKRGSPVGLLALLLVVVAGAGGWWWTQQGGAAEQGGRAAPQRRALLLHVAGNRIDAQVASCESAEGWALKAGGLGFRPSGDAHTGRGGLRAHREDDASDAPTANLDDYAILRLSEPLEVFAGRTLTVSAYCRTRGDGLIGLRAVAFAQSEDSPFRFVSGTAVEARDGWQRLEAVVTVPDGCDRLQVELAAAIPSEAAEAHVDDVAIVEGGDNNGLKVKLDTGLTAFGFGSSMAVRSADPQSPATVLALVPAEVPEALEGLRAAGECALSDVGGTITVDADDGGFGVEVAKVSSIAFVLPEDSGGGLMIAGADGSFASSPAESEFEAASVLFGQFGTRAMLRFEQPVSVRGAAAGGAYSLAAQASSATLVVGFRAERQAAGALVRDARESAREGEPRAALAALAKVFISYPMDSTALQNAQQLRTQILEAQSATARQLEEDLEQAGFFDTRGGFERVCEGIDDLVVTYGETNVEGLDDLRALRAKAEQRLESFDRLKYTAQRERLMTLAAAFGAVSEPRLQKMVQDYIARFLPAESAGGGETGGKD